MAWRRGEKKKPIEEKPEEKQWPKGKQKPKPTEEAERVELKPIPHEKPEEKPTEQLELEPTQVEGVVIEQPEQAEQVPWRRGQKKPSVDEQPDEKQLPMGKRKPQPKEEVEKVQLKPTPRKKPEVAKPKEQPELKPVKKNEIPVESPTEAKETILPKVLPSKAQIKAPKFVKKLQPEMCKPNEPVELRATVEGTPFPEVKWFFNDAELHATENFEMNIIEKAVTLKISKVTPELVGTYSCQVKNEAGVAISRTNIALGKCNSLYIHYICLMFKLINFHKNITKLLPYKLLKFNSKPKNVHVYSIPCKQTPFVSESQNKKYLQFVCNSYVDTDL